MVKYEGVEGGSFSIPVSIYTIHKCSLLAWSHALKSLLYYKNSKLAPLHAMWEQGWRGGIGRTHS
jgi:hypothetical protein